MNKASGRAAFILATGLFLCSAGASAASPDAATVASKSDSVTGAAVAHSKYRHHRHQAHRGSDKAAKPTVTKDADVEAASPIPPQVANANAQLAAADTPAGGAKEQPAQAAAPQTAPNNAPAAQPGADNQAAATDQLNDVDRMLQEEPAGAAPVVTQASNDASPGSPAPRPAPAMAASSDGSAWNQSSLVGKIFIAFGALLTVASAARMFMA